jgi:nucleoside 2-deoxyribosyltransferase
MTRLWQDRREMPEAPIDDDPRPRCYIASPLGFTEAGRDYYARVYLPALATVVLPVDPWALTTAEELETARVEGRQREITLTVGRRNIDAMHSCVLLAAHLDGQEADSGTAAEVGYAAAIGLTCFGLRTDLRQSGEDGAALNLQVEAFIVESGGRIAETLDGLIADLAVAVQTLRA